MILDKNALLIDGSINTAANFMAVDTGMLYAGRADMVLMLNVTEECKGGTKIALQLQESDTETGTYTDVANALIELDGDDLKVGARGGSKYIPSNVKKRWIKFKSTLTGTFTAGQIVSGLVRELDQPYTDGLYINKGQVVG